MSNRSVERGKEQIENVIMNFPNLVGEVDLTAFMDEEQIHRIKDAGQYFDKLKELICGGGERGLSMPFHSMSGNFEFRKSELTVWAGYKGHGKSMLASQILEHLMDAHGQKVFIISPEFPPHRVLHRMLLQSVGNVFEGMDENSPKFSLLRQWVDVAKEQLWIYDQQSSLKPQDIPALCRFAIERLGVQHILIDSLMKCGISPDDYGRQKRLVDDIQQIAHRSEAHIHLIAHLRKGNSDSEIGGLHDVKGASEIADLAENVIVVWRNKNKELNGVENEPDAVVKVEAQRNANGWIGKSPLIFDKQTFTFKDWTIGC
jgi:twinkle protein